MKSICLLLLASPFFFPGYNALLKPKEKAIEKEPKQDYMAYYHYVNLSNRSIYSGDLSNAALYLDSAFTNIKTPYFKDLQKMVILNWKLNRPERNTDLLNLIIKTKRIDTTQLRTLFPKEIIVAFNTNQLPDKLSVQMQSYKNQFELLFKNDQDKRMFYDFKDTTNLLLNNPNFIGYRKSDSLDALNAKRFIDLVKLNGFPTENNMAYLINNKVEGAYYKTMELNEVISILIRHFSKTKYKKEILNILENAHASHSIHPSYYAFLKDYFLEYDKNKRDDWSLRYLVPSVVTYGESIGHGKFYRPIINYSKGLLDTINTSRISIGLDSLHIEQHQIISQQLCRNSSKNKIFEIPTNSFIKIENTMGVAMWALEKQGRKIDEFYINPDKIRKECKCSKLIY